MTVRRSGAALFVVLVIGTWQAPGAGQLPLAPYLDRGETVTPAFEGWYENPDGTFNLSFGYYNRNFEEAVDIPVGPNNRIEPGPLDQGQPTHFLPRRAWGVFTITVPKDFGTREVVWTLVNRGQTLSVPGHLKREWMIDAISGDANNNRPPVIRFSSDGPTGQGPKGIWAPPMTTAVGTPLPLTVWATDDGQGSRIASEPREELQLIALRWVKHAGPGEVTFEAERPEIPKGQDSIESTTTVTFSEPGDYTLRVHAMDLAGESGSDQCCWTNGYVKVSVK